MKLDLEGKKIAILWFGREGKSSLQFLLKSLSDSQNIDILDQDKVQKPIDFKWNIIFWDNYLSNLDKYDYIIKSPWISSYKDELIKVQNKLLTQANIFFDNYNWKIISITQTKWKSTTATLVYQILKNAWYNVKLVWNIWNPVLDEIDLNSNYDFVVFELSSYMLEDLKNHHSEISILGNIYPDHLDWHLNFENYKKAKKNVLKNAKNILVWLQLYPDIEKNLLNRKILSFGWDMAYYSHKNLDFYINSKKIDINIKPLIPWDHNLDNFAWVLWVCDILWIDYKIFKQTINNFKWLNHRLENIWTFAWIKFIDDAISTTPESTIAAINTYKFDIWCIFLGWTDRWYNFENLVKKLEQYKIKNIVLFKDSWQKIKTLLKTNYNILETNNMYEAIEFAFKNTWIWKICLLSTASPSYSLWKNFEQKWNEFKNEILNFMNNKK